MKFLKEIAFIGVILILFVVLYGVQRYVANLPDSPVDFSRLGVVRIISQGSGRYMSAATLQNGARLTQDSRSEELAQVWQLEKHNDGWLIKSVNSNQCLEVAESAITDGATVQLWECLGTPGQVWYLERMAGYYQIQASHTQGCLEVEDSSKEVGARIQQWSCADVLGQRWQINTTLY